MRTTVVIDDALLRQAKHAAAEAGCSLSDLVNQALSMALARRGEPRADFHMVAYGGDSAQGHEPADFKDELDAQDAESLGR